MTRTLTIPFHFFKLQLHAGQEVFAPLMDGSVLSVSDAPEALITKMHRVIEDKVIAQGQFDVLLQEHISGDFEQSSISVEFKRARDGMAYPPLSLDFDVYTTVQNGLYWAFVPVLALETFGKDPAQLQETITEAIRIHLSRQERTLSVQRIISVLWYEGASLHRTEMAFNLPTLKDMSRAEEHKKKLLLPRAGTRLKAGTQPTAYGHEAVLRQLGGIFQGRFVRNVLLVGAGGSGKTALAKEAARRWMLHNSEAQVWGTSASKLVQVLMSYQRPWEEMAMQLAEELAPQEHTFLLINNLNDLFEVGKSVGNTVSVGEFLRPFLAAGKIKLIAECTEAELAHIEQQVPNYLTLFQIVRVEHPKLELESIIRQKAKAMARAHKAVIAPEGIAELIRLTQRFTPDAGMPGKPIRSLENMLLLQQNSPSAARHIGKDEALRYFCEETGMPRFMIDDQIPMDTAAIKNRFNEAVFGQAQAVQEVVSMLAAVKAAMTRTGKPIASFLFVGPTGVGKTELAKVLAQFMFGSTERLQRFDMSEFAAPDASVRLMGYGQAEGALTSAIRKEPFSVLLFDEIEKADKGFYDLLLQILSEGRLTDGKGKAVNFCSTVILMTSNIGATRLQNGLIKWDRAPDLDEEAAAYVSAVEKHFRPELVNRIDQIISFAALSPDTVRHVVAREMQLLKAREGIHRRRMTLHIAPEVYDYLAQVGYHPKYGARYLQRVMREQLLLPLARTLNKMDMDEQLDVAVTLADGRIDVQAEENLLSLELLIEEVEKRADANQASHLRRALQALMEGPMYQSLLAQLDMMEAEKRRDEAAFWSDRERASSYATHIIIAEVAQQLSAAIARIETGFALAALGLQPYRTDLFDELGAWPADFDKFKINLLAHLFPESSTCHFGIFGSAPMWAARLYAEIFQQKNFVLKSIQAAWHNEEGYHYSPLDEDLSAIPSHRPGNTLCGVTFHLQGPCVHLYLNPETGRQKQEVSDKETIQYIVQASTQPLRPPNNVHKASFFRTGSIRRTISPQKIQDTQLKMNREHRNKIPELLIEELDERFRQTINAAFAADGG